MVLAELTAPCPVGSDDCLQLEQLRIDRSTVVVAAWRERVPSATAGTHVGVLAATNRFTPRLQVSTSSNLPIRVLTTSPLRYAVLTKEASTWGSLLADFTGVGAAPQVSDKVSTSLSDELVRNFTDVSTADNETYTVAFGAKAGTVHLGGSVQAQVVATPTVTEVPTRPLRERFVGVPSLINSFLWLGTTQQGQGFRVQLSAADGAAMLAFGPFGLVRASTTDVPGCRVDRAGFPSLVGVGTRGGGIAGWLESNDEGTACNVRVDGAVLNAAGTHVLKLALNERVAVWEQQAAANRIGPSELMLSQRDPVSLAWSLPVKLSSQPVSRLLAQTSNPGSAAWSAVVWQECASEASNAECKSYVAKNQSSQFWTLAEVQLPKDAGQPMVSINYYGDAIAAWVEPRAACTSDRSKQCAQVRGRRF